MKKVTIYNNGQKLFVVKLVIYPYDVMIYFGKNQEPLYKELSKYISSSEIQQLREKQITRGDSVMFNNGASLIRMPNVPRSINDLATLNHEVFHVVFFILQEIGIKLVPQSDEAFAYLIEYINKEIYKKISISF
mgnify:FL=1